MSKKSTLIVSLVIIAAFSYGISVGHYKVFPYDLIESTKSLVIKPQERDAARPQIYQDMATVKDLIRIKNSDDIIQKRNKLIDYLWLGQGFPHDKMPKVEDNIKDSDFSDLKNLKQINSITTEMEYGMNSISYLFLPEKSNNKLVIFHQGHEGQSFAQDKRIIQFFLEKNYSVLIFAMVTYGMNNEPVIDLPEFGKLRLNSHNHFKFIESSTFHPMKYFIEPVVVALNYVDLKFDFDSYYMIGLSGGGWTTVVYSAIDPRITQSYSIAGSFPIWLRADSRNFGDYEQNLPEFYRIANYEELYVMSSYGENRHLVQFFNKFDPCCFSGDLYEQFPYENTIKEKLNDLQKGRFDVYVDDTIHEHRISDITLTKIADMMENQ